MRHTLPEILTLDRVRPDMDVTFFHVNPPVPADK
jgi:hypothetical protein